MIAKKHLNYIK